MAGILTLIIVLFFGIGWVTACDSRLVKEQFITDHIVKPYCVDESSTILGKTSHFKRCWKVIEVDP